MQPHFCNIQLVDSEASQSDLSVSNLQGTIKPTQSLQSGCGEDLNALVLEALPGQQFYITMLDFYWSNRSAQACDVIYGTLYDFERKESRNLCGGGRRNVEVMLTHGHRVKITFNTHSASKFVLQYEGT